ncbi:MAG: dihydroneopterin aldolase [Pseudomonadota bacterium]|nr:dihydroneopterin aldolase [Pseudomonadota bacterium]
MTSNQAKVVQPLRIADARNAVRHVFIRDYMVDCSIGIHSHEKEHEQRVRINLDLAVWEGETPINDDIRNVICYEHLAKRIERIVGEGHVNLVETLAEKITAMCLEEDRVYSARVRVEKLDILSNAKSVGVEIERFNSQV